LPATIWLKDNDGTVFGPWRRNDADLNKSAAELKETITKLKKAGGNLRTASAEVREAVDNLKEEATGWVVWPNVLLPAGTYEIMDSDTDTWSFNEKSNYAGFSLVWGFAPQ
jgi:hypothetical protein